MSEKYIGGRFLEDCLYCYPQKITSAVAKETLTRYISVQRAPEIQNFSYCNSECQLKTNQKNVKYVSVFKEKDFDSCKNK